MPVYEGSIRVTQLPRLSHLQFVVVGILRNGWIPGRTVREELKRFEIRKSGPAFYQLMARLEDAGLVKGKYDQEIVDGQIIRQRHYTLTSDGSRAWEASRDFYMTVIRGLDPAAGAAGA